MKGRTKQNLQTLLPAQKPTFRLSKLQSSLQILQEKCSCLCPHAKTKSSELVMFKVEIRRNRKKRGERSICLQLETPNLFITAGRKTEEWKEDEIFNMWKSGEQIYCRGKIREQTQTGVSSSAQEASECAELQAADMQQQQTCSSNTRHAKSAMQPHNSHAAAADTQQHQRCSNS